MPVPVSFLSGFRPQVLIKKIQTSPAYNSGIARYATGAISHIVSTSKKDTFLALNILGHPCESLRKLDRHLTELIEVAVLVQKEDPAVKNQNLWTIINHYPGLISLAAHRKANALWKRADFDKAYYLAMKAKERTGMEIHPGATIGKNVIFDHCEALILGETCEVGDGCLLHHELTLGATGKKEDIVQETQRRHAKVGSKTALGFGCKIFGGIEIGNNCVVGAESFIWGGPETKIADNVHLGPKVVLRKLQIGEGSRIGSEARIIGNGDGIELGRNLSIREAVTITGSGIEIADGVQIGKQVQIIGDNFKIAENENIPDGAVVIGNDNAYSVVRLEDRRVKDVAERLEALFQRVATEQQALIEASQQNGGFAN